MSDYCPNRLLTQIFGFHNSPDYKEFVMVIAMVITIKLDHQKDLQRIIEQEQKILNFTKEQH